MSGSISFDLTDIATSDFSKSHLAIISELMSLNPTLSLELISANANELTALATCPVRITPKVLILLGYEERPCPRPHPHPEIDEPTNGDGRTPESTTAVTQLTSRIIRTQLEERHNKIQERVEDLLDEDVISNVSVKVFQMLSQIDEKLVSQLLELMNEETAPLLPMAIIVLCLRQQGVPEDDIAFIQQI